MPLRRNVAFKDVKPRKNGIVGCVCVRKLSGLAVAVLWQVKLSVNFHADDSPSCERSCPLEPSLSFTPFGALVLPPMAVIKTPQSTAQLIFIRSGSPSTPTLQLGSTLLGMVGPL